MSKMLLRILPFFVLITSNSFSQNVESISLNGEEYFVYPFKIEVKNHNAYNRILKVTNFGRLSYKNYAEVWGEEGASSSREEYREFKQFMKELDSDYSNEDTYLSKKFIRAARKNPFPLLDQTMLENVDIIPALDPIPDGKYVQMYEDFCFPDKKGNCVENTPFIAGFFTIKDNTLDGEATWIDLKGDTLKHGWFKNGLKEGEWKFVSYITDYSLSQKDTKMYIERGDISKDTLTETIQFKNGARNGKYTKFVSSAYPVEEGFYTNDERSGEWIFRQIVFKGIGPFRKRNRNNELITERYTLNTDRSMIVRPLWIRKDKINVYQANHDQFNFMSDYELAGLPRLYDIAFEKELVDEEEELGVEEMEELYYGMNYSDSYYTRNFMSESSFEEYGSWIYDENSMEFIKQGALLDSIGGIPNFIGLFEKHYSNGQLMMRFEIKDGKLVDQGILYWDNGVVHDKIEFVADSNHYLRSVFDYDGKPYLELVYDERGDFLHVQKDYETLKQIELEGLMASPSEYGMYFYYDHWDTLKCELNDPLVLFRSWNVVDSSRAHNSFYTPSERKLERTGYSISGKKISIQENTFTEDFKSWRGKSTNTFLGLELVTTASGTLREMVEPDTIPQRNIREMNLLFDVAEEHVLMKEGSPYTGSVKMDFSKKKLSVSKKEMTLHLPEYEYKVKKIKKDIEKYRRTGKTKYPRIVESFRHVEISRGKGTVVFSNVFDPLLTGFFGPYYSDFEYDYEYEELGRRAKKKGVRPQLEKLEGQLLDGKPEGIWIGYDQFGKKMIEVPFEKGEANGTVNHYNYVYPKPKENEGFFFDNEEEQFKDSFPAKKQYFLSMTSDYKNGFLDGKEISYDWLGEVQSEFNYKEGIRNGEAIERNKIAMTKSYFENGQLDGYVQTYLTLPDRDSILLFDLNFQDGMLQGESKSYHTNGSIAKRGFFLNGEPIEDYEAFDSLGVKYHYVKFKYSFPVEEKIWEENELSVRYQFDWQDSIYFTPSDITTSQSLESILYDLGYGNEYLERPYLGRPSLVEKRGVSYHMTKYFPNDTVSRYGELEKSRKVGCWKYYNYYGEPLYEVDYFDTIIQLNDSIRFFSKGIYTELNAEGHVLSESYVIEKSEKYDCSHSDHYEIRQFFTIWEENDSTHRTNGYVKNYFDNGTIQSEGEMKDGLPVGMWKYYDPFGKLNKYGNYVLGKRDGRWLSGDLSKTKYLGDICLNPNLPNLENEIKYRENLLDITIINYSLGKTLNRQYYDLDMNQFTDLEEDEVFEEE